MSNRNNDVFQVLVTKGNQAVLAKNQAISALAPGQLGAFDSNTNLSIDSTSSPIPREFYLAVGIDRTGSATLEDIRKSAGQLIQRQGIRAYSFRPHTAARPMIVTIGGYKANCETDYTVRVEFRNSAIYRVQGFNQFSKAYTVTTGCCDECAEGCDTADANTLTKLFVEAINGDVAALLTAKIIARQDIDSGTVGTSVDYNAGDVVTAADLLVMIAYNADSGTADEDKVYTDFSIESKPLPATSYNQVNLHYHKFLSTVLVVSLVDGFNCSGVATTTQEAAYEEGSATNIQNKEYHASGWNGAGSYVLSETTGTPKGNIEYLTDPTKKYDQFWVEYDQTSESGWLEYMNPLSTLVANPEADTTARASIATLLDALTPDSFDNLADEAAASSTTATVVEGQPSTAALDGIA